MKNKEKGSWFERLLGRRPYYDYDDYEEGYEDEYYDEEGGEVKNERKRELREDVYEGDEYDDSMMEEDQELEKTNLAVGVGEGALNLQINLIDKSDELVAQAVVAGVDEDDIDINITREMLEVEISSNKHSLERDGDVLYEELIAGSFARTLLLPAEIEVEHSKAKVKNGILTITMPKIDKTTQRKLSVKSKD